MERSLLHRMTGAMVSIGAAAILAGTPLLFGVRRPALAAADTPIVNQGIAVNALNPSDDIHEVANNVDPTNHQISARYPNTTADFVISLSGINNTGSNFTAPITASWHTQGNGSTTSFTAESGMVSFANRYAQQYQFVKIPVHFNASLYSEPVGSYDSFNLVISSATNASIGRTPATVYIYHGAQGAQTP